MEELCKETQQSFSPLAPGIFQVSWKLSFLCIAAAWKTSQRIQIGQRYKSRIEID